jgi:hypothetical protein
MRRRERANRKATKLRPFRAKKGSYVETYDDEAGECRANEARGVEDDAVDRDGGGKLGARDEARDQGEARRLVEADHHALDEHEGDQDLDRDQAAPGECEQGEGLQHDERLRDLDHPEPVGAVGEHAAEGADDHRGEEVGEGDQPEHRAGMAELPCEPADADALHPGADQRGPVAGDVDAEIAVPQGARDRVPARGQPHRSHTLSGSRTQPKMPAGPLLGGDA